ncbi:MAG TPA: hypothetical protein VIN38_13040 [Thiobacillus sp.]
MSNRTIRLLMLWLFVALQAMTPFIHAHADSAQLNHGGLFHVHQSAHTDVIYHAIAAHDHGAEFQVAAGVPARKCELGIASSGQVFIVNPFLHRIDISTQQDARYFNQPPRFLTLPEHTLRHALAPPSA